MTPFIVRIGVVAGIAASLVVAGGRMQTHAQQATEVPCTQSYGKPLLSAPVIASHVSHGQRILKAFVRVVDDNRTLWGNTDDPRCANPKATLRFFEGIDATKLTTTTPWPWPARSPDPIPGPTFRVWTGDLVEITFLNELDQNDFAYSLDRSPTAPPSPATPLPSGAPSPPSGDLACDKATFRHAVSTAQGATFPNCLHGSSTTNIHFHGTHTSPITTGDDVLLFVRPALRADPNTLGSNGIVPSETDAFKDLQAFYQDQCETSGTPPENAWLQARTHPALPLSKWTGLQKSWLKQYDDTQPYQGQTPSPGHPALPPTMQLSPANEREILHGLWPQYHIGAVPVCFRLPTDGDPPTYHGKPVRMGQAPGTHWYHAHKHGSTALNVANGMTGAFIIQGKYDRDLHRFYNRYRNKYYPGHIIGAPPLPHEQVLVIQQLSTVPFNATNPAIPGPGASRPRLSVNGRLEPVITMRPGEVQLWRIVNGAFRDAVQFDHFGARNEGRTTACQTSAPPSPAGPGWRQIAQDGVQFHVLNYDRVGKLGAKFNLAAANRADVLLKAPLQTGTYALCIVKNIGRVAKKGPGQPPTTLLTLNVGGGTPVDMAFIDDVNFPTFPHFLDDITDNDVKTCNDPQNPTRKTPPCRFLEFGAGNTTINNKSFADGRVNQEIKVGQSEEWVVMNDATDKSHPFHIHINPFQITELFEPNYPNPNCPVDPANPRTFDPRLPGYKPCHQFSPQAGYGAEARFVWWDTFPIPTASKPAPFTCDKTKGCDAASLARYGATCTPAGAAVQTCKGERIPGWFRMRSRFVDFTGQYVLHCHILIHEDLGMMQLVEVYGGAVPPSPMTMKTHH
jgi:FtsP/CotA-like multicopper oxidase with cupredoxin domain